MKLTLPICALTLVVSASIAEAATCTPTGYFRDAINLTAALINPPGKVSGDVDATGCNIGIYYSSGHGHVKRANVHGANYFGIVNNGANVEIEDSTISDIGEKPFNGAQHGVAIYWVFGSAARGNIHHNLIWNYQKGGIVVNGSAAKSEIKRNTVIGLGPVSFIAQNGIQAGWGADVKIEKNFVAGNSYKGTSTASGGILLVGGTCYGGDLQTRTEVEHNTALNNDVGLYFSNLDVSGPDCVPPTTLTKNTAKDNSLVNNAINNPIYQAGISDVGNSDVIHNNDICGLGYPETATPTLFAIDVTYTNNPKVKGNTYCGAKSTVLNASALAARQARAKRGKSATARPVR